MKEVLSQFVFAALSSTFFSIFFNAPLATLFESSIIGGVSWIISNYAKSFTGSLIVGTFVGCSIIGIMAELFAAKRKRPATVYLISSIIPFVPGAGTYDTLVLFFDKNYGAALEKGVETVGVAIAISFGIIFASFLSVPIRRIRTDVKKKHSK